MTDSILNFPLIEWGFKILIIGNVCTVALFVIASLWLALLFGPSLLAIWLLDIEWYYLLWASMMVWPFVSNFVSSYRNWLKLEKNLIEIKGPKRALWWQHRGSRLVAAALDGLDLMLDQAGETKPFWQDLSSEIWSYSVLAQDEIFSHVKVVYFVLPYLVYAIMVRPVKITANLCKRILWLSVGICWLIVLLEPVSLFYSLYAIVAFISGLPPVTLLFEWFCWRLTTLATEITVAAMDIKMYGRKFTPVLKGDRNAHSAKYRTRLMQFGIVISDVGLPHWIRGSRAPTREGLEQSLALLRELGWPVNVKTTAESFEFPEAEKWKEWVLCGTDWKQGIRNMKTYNDELLDKLRINAVYYRRSEEYASFDNELESTSRYFQSPRYNFPDLSLDDVWFMLRDTFEHSRLTPFGTIISKMEKKYGVGAFFRKPGSLSKLSRKQLIKDLGGYAGFKELWRKTFSYAALVVPVAAVSVKGEALPPKKWMNDKIRSIIGTPLVHYIASTIWNYQPNHSFQWTRTPAKVGMPLNGYWLADIYHRHSRCQIHYAGDFTAFDSTLSGKLIDMIKAVRKKGFEHHKDYESICELIDVCYEQLSHQLLNTTSTGNVYKKGTGLATGHSSTTADNCIAIDILYLMAWKELTGLGAKEFKHYNELSNYGDDHVLSVLATKPKAWNFKNIQRTMNAWGVGNKLEAHGPLDTMPFLSKFCRQVTSKDVEIFNKHQVAIPKLVIYHDKDKLIGKMTANVKSADPKYRAKRLLSYLSLTAHHEDVYWGIHRVLTRSSTMKRALKVMNVQVPTYQKILADWYSPSAQPKPNPYLDEDMGQDDGPVVYHYGKVEFSDTLAGVIASIPDFLNPTLFNFGYQRNLQLQLRDQLQWVYDFLAHANDCVSIAEVARIAVKTGYGVLDLNLMIRTACDRPEQHLLKHWLFLSYKWMTFQRTFSLLGPISNKISSLQFALNGVSYTTSGGFEFMTLDILVLALLSFIPSCGVPAILMKIRLPRVDLILETIYKWILASIWTAIPPNYSEVTHVVRNLKGEQRSILITAPTGTGKSTAFINHLVLTVGHKYKKIVVIEPRSVLVTSLVPFMRQAYGMSCTGRTSGFDFDKREQVWYVTPQEASIHFKETFDVDNLIVLDEAHIDEPFYAVMRKLLPQMPNHVIYQTATPSGELSEISHTTVALEIANVWTVQRDVYRAPKISEKLLLTDYEEWATDQINGMWHRSKVLFFHPNINRAHQLAERIPYKVSFLNSKEKDVTGQIIICTSVADAGITIPQVDLVITPNFDTFVSSDDIPVFGLLSELTISQRKGRTGRTNNGKMVLYQTPLQLPSARSLMLNPRSIVRSWVEQGISAELLTTAMRQELISGLGLDSESITEAELEVYLQSFVAFANNLKYFIQTRTPRVIRLEDDFEARDFDYTAAGYVASTSHTSLANVVSYTLRGSILAGRLSLSLPIDLEEAREVFQQLAKVPALEKQFKELVSKENWDTAWDLPDDD